MRLAQDADFADRHVLVTGATRGIGYAIARQYLERGALVAIAGTDVDKAMEAAARLSIDVSGRAYGVGVDVSDFSSVERAFSAIAAAGERPLDTLINNAGISPKVNGQAARIWEMEPDQWQQVISVNLTGVFHCIRCAVPVMKAAGRGWIVNMSSLAAKVYSPIVGCHYTASKAALIGLTRQLAGEVGPFGIHVNAVTPGRIATAMTASISEEAYKAQVADTPFGRFGQADEVADVTLFLTSQKSSFVTGQVVDVAGGYCMT